MDEQRANDIQVGGTHYQTEYQHWDFADDLRMGYYEGQITKYITRHRSKKGLEDAQKARHFAVKLLERAVYRGRQPMHAVPTVDMTLRFREANKLNDAEVACITDVCTWKFVPDLHRLLASIDTLIRLCYPHSTSADTDGSAPGKGYVDQDR